MLVEKVIRASLINFSLDTKNKEMFDLLVSEDWDKYILSEYEERGSFTEQLELFEDMFGNIEGIRDRLNDYRDRKIVEVSRTDPSV